MNWFAYLSRSLAVLPYVVAGIQTIHKDANGATKKQLAMESLGLAVATAGAVLPTHQATESQAIGAVVGSVIDLIVQQAHATNTPGFGNNMANVAKSPLATPLPAA